MTVTVISARVVVNDVRAVVRAEDKPRAAIRLTLRFPITGEIDIWAAAKDEALKYLDPS